MNSISQLKHDLAHINLFYIDNEYPHEPLSMYPRSPTPKGYQSPIDNNCYHCNGFPMQQQLETLISHSLLNNNMNTNFSSSVQSNQVISPTINHDTLPFSPEVTNRRINRQTQATNQRKISTPKFDMSTPLFVDRSKQPEHQQCLGPIFGLDQITSDKYNQIQNYVEKLLNDTSIQIQNEGLLVSPSISPQQNLNVQQQQQQQQSKAERNRKNSMKLKKQQTERNSPKRTKSLPRAAMKLNPEPPIISRGPIKQADKKLSRISQIKRPNARIDTSKKKVGNLNKSSDDINYKTNSTFSENDLSFQCQHSKRSLPTLNRSTETINKQKQKQETLTPILKRKAIGSNESLKISQHKTPINNNFIQRQRKAKSPTPCLRLQVPDNNNEIFNTSTMTIRAGKSSENLFSNIKKQPFKLPVKSKSFVLSSSNNNQSSNSTKMKRGPSDLNVGAKAKSSIALNKLRDIEKHLHGTLSTSEYYLELDKV